MVLIEPSQRWSGSNRVHLEAHALGPTLPWRGGGRIRRPQLPQPSPILPEPVRWVHLSLQTPAGGAEEEFRLSRGRWEEKVGKQSKNEGGLRDGGEEGGALCKRTSKDEGWCVASKGRHLEWKESSCRKGCSICSSPRKASRWSTAVQLVEVLISSQ